jgi:hypothetical protein
VRPSFKEHIMAFTNSASTPKETFLNGYRWTGNDKKDNAIKWAQETETAVLVNQTDIAAIETPVATAAGRGPSPLIWSDVNWNDLSTNPESGSVYYDDYMGNSVIPASTTAVDGGWTVTRATAGTMGSIIGDGGILNLTAAATADQGMNAQLLNCCVVPTAGRTIHFEARVKISDIDNQIFIGMASTQTAIIASGVLDETTMSAVGFFTDEPSATTKYGTIVSKAGTNDTTEDIAVGFVADTYAKIGFVMDGVTSVAFYYNGVLVETGSTANTMPAVALGLSLVCQNEDGSNVNTLDVDWVRVAQVL